MGFNVLILGQAQRLVGFCSLILDFFFFSCGIEFATCVSRGWIQSGVGPGHSHLEGLMLTITIS